MIGIAIRVALYAAVFFGAFIVGLPRLFYEIDRRWPSWHVDIGPFRWVGAALFALGLAGYFGAMLYLVTRGRGAYVEFDPPKQFVCTGPYRWVRNPIVDCVALMLAGEAIFFSSTGLALYFLLAVVVGVIQVTLIEEPLLRKRFGEAYERYRQQVPRFIPRPPRSRQESREVRGSDTQGEGA